MTDRFSDGGEDPLGGSEYFTGGCGCGGVEGGGVFRDILGRPSGIAKGNALEIATAVTQLSIIIILLVIFIPGADANHPAFIWTMGIVLAGGLIATGILDWKYGALPEADQLHLW